MNALARARLMGQWAVLFALLRFFLLLFRIFCEKTVFPFQIQSNTNCLHFFISQTVFLCFLLQTKCEGGEWNSLELILSKIQALLTYSIIIYIRNHL